PEADDIMQRPPRALTSSPFAAANIGAAVVQGIGTALVLLAGYGGMLGLGVAAAHSRTAIFIALVIGLFALILANRHPDHALMARGGMRNRWLRPMFAAILVLLALAIGVPFLREVMGLVVPTLADLLVAAIV